MIVLIFMYYENVDYSQKEDVEFPVQIKLPLHAILVGES